MAARMMRRPEGLLYPKWNSEHGPRPDDYPTPTKLQRGKNNRRTDTPPLRLGSAARERTGQLAAARALPKGEVRPKVGRPAKKFTFWSSWPAARRRRGWRAVRWPIFMIGMALLFGGNLFALQSLSRSLSLAALPAGDTAGASAQLIGIGANVSATLVTASIGGLVGAHVLAIEAGRGVDVVDVCATR